MACVYQHRRNDTNEIFYIGIGNSEYRAYRVGRNTHWDNIYNKVGRTVEIILSDRSRSECEYAEKYLIAYYGRKDLGRGSLVNKTDGGEIGLSIIRSEKQRKEHSEFMKEYYSKHDAPNKNKPLTDEQRITFSKAQKKRFETTDAWNKNKSMSEESKQKMRDTKLKNKKPVSLETREKLSHSAKLDWQKRKTNK